MKRWLPYAAENDCREFDREFMRLLLREFDTRLSRHVSPENKEMLYHGRTWMFQRMVKDDFSPCVGTLDQHTVEARIEFHRVLANDLTLIADYIHKTVGALEEQFLKQLLDETTSVGAAVSVPKGGSLADAFLEMVRNSDVSVGPDGKVSTPNLYLFGAGYQEQLQRELDERGPEFKKKIEDIQETKRKEALEREQRRLARFDGTE